MCSHTHTHVHLCQHVSVHLITPRPSYLVDVTHFPEEHKELLVELDTFTGARQVGLGQRVVQKSCDALQQEGKVLQTTSHCYTIPFVPRQKAEKLV